MYFVAELRSFAISINNFDQLIGTLDTVDTYNYFQHLDNDTLISVFAIYTKLNMNVCITNLMQTVMPLAVGLVCFLYPRFRVPAECTASYLNFRSTEE